MLPAGPTVADLMANAAFYFGLVRTLAESERPLWSQMSFKAAEENFEAAAEHGIDAEIYWPRRRPGAGDRAGAAPAAADGHEGLDAWGVPSDGVRPAARHHRAALPDRASTARSGSSARWPTRGDEDRFDALRHVLLEYRERMHTNEPVHTWD